MAVKVGEKIKSINKKTMLGASSILMIVAIIAVSSFFPFIIDPTRWQTVDFLTKEVIIIVIVISGTISSLFIGQSQNADDPRSEIAKAKVAFKAVNDQVKNQRSAFSQWVKKVMEPADEKEKTQRLLAINGIKQPSILNLDRTEIKELVGKPMKYGEVFYSSITEKQYNFLMDFLDGKYAIRYVSPEYYLTVSSIQTSKTRSEKAGKETFVKTTLLTTSLVSRIIRSMLFGMTFASLVYDSATAQSDAERAMAWMTFVTRMGSLVMSCFSGYFLGAKTNDVEADYILLRVGVQTDFLNDKNFRPKTDSELAKEEFIERVKEENSKVLELENNSRLLEKKDG